MPDPFPNELVEAAAVVCYSLAPEHDTSTYPHGYVPYDEARPSSRENARADALEVLTALYPLIEQRVIDRLAREAGENPYPEFHLPEHDGATGYADPCHAAWDEGAACGVAACGEGELLDAHGGHTAHIVEHAAEVAVVGDAEHGLQLADGGLDATVDREVERLKAD